MNKMKQTNKNGNNTHPPSKSLISVSGITGVVGVGFLIFIAMYSGSIIVGGFVLVFLLIPALMRYVRGQSKRPLSEQGNGTSDNFSIVDGVVQVRNGGSVWSKPLSEYEGVLRREETTNFSSKFDRRPDNYTLQIIELRHNKKRDFDVNLYTSLEDVGVRARWEEAAREFNLPALRDLGDGKLLRREPGDVGKSLRELAPEGRVDASFDPDAPVPPGVNWSLEDQVLRIYQQRARWRSFATTVPFVLFYWLVGYNLPFDVIFGRADASMLPVYRAIILSPAVLIAGLWVLVSLQITVTPGEVAVSGRLGSITLWRKALTLNEVEEVLVDPSLVIWHTVLIESVSSALRIWPLSEASARWLAQFLRSAIANAPDDDARDGSLTSPEHQ